MGNHESRINKKNLNHVSREKNSSNHVSRKKYRGPSFDDGQSNNSLVSKLPTKTNLECLPCLYDLDLFSMNSLDENLNPHSNLEFPRVERWYFSPHSLSISQQESSLSFFHNNIVSLNNNLDNLVAYYLDELDFHFNVIGVTETKTTKSNEHLCNYQIPDYNFKQVPTPLVSGGVGLFIDDTLNYTVLEKTSTEAFQALWVEFSFLKQKNIICGIIYRQHNSPDLFLNSNVSCLQTLTSYFFWYSNLPDSEQ